MHVILVVNQQIQLNNNFSNKIGLGRQNQNAAAPPGVQSAADMRSAGPFHSWCTVLILLHNDILYNFYCYYTCFICSESPVIPRDNDGSPMLEI